MTDGESNRDPLPGTDVTLTDDDIAKLKTNFFKGVNVTDRQPGTCKWCGQPTAPGSRGPVPEYCSRGHRQRAYEARQLPALGALLRRIIEDDGDEIVYIKYEDGELALDGRWTLTLAEGAVVERILGPGVSS